MFESCYLEALDDDCMAVHGSLYHISGAGDSPGTFIAPLNTAAAAGDVLRFYATENYEPLGTATVTRAVSPDSLRGITVDNLPEKASSALTTTFSNQNRVGSGFAVLNTSTTGNRGRGAIIKASTGIIAHKVFEGVSYAALDLGLEVSDWGEMEYVSNISIVNDTI